MWIARLHGPSEVTKRAKALSRRAASRRCRGRYEALAADRGFVPKPDAQLSEWAISLAHLSSHGLVTEWKAPRLRADKRNADIRLHCCRRRLGRRRRGEPAVGRPAQQGAAARGRSGQPSLVVHPDRHGPADQKSRSQLALFLRARGEHQRPPAPGAARQTARRLQLDQRNGVCARPGAGLRHLGADGQPRLELR